MLAEAGGRPVAVVTGVSSGIGEAVARRLLDDGWAVTGISRRRPAFESAHLTWLQADLLDPAAVDAVAARAPDPDAVVHAAGVLRSAPLGSLDPDALATMWRLHVDVPSRLVDALAGRLADGGRVVLIGSRTSVGTAGKSQYAATKAAQEALSRSWAIELAPRQVTVNVVAPGPTRTAMLDDPGRSGTPPQVPSLGRFVEPSEVAALVAFLLGPDGRSITGQRLVVCGGASL
ncbi:NAD(P)-dependent dehydrogenase, short-chain alcohol dehydrogenase family [Microlunatus sagamiharensis]|uniref:NAD(P)-dependent dehydrogenase, short-chain alcohol dehydrogenase family n=1 Tax=Microlunatus sagamiharensis TaxID=546874 RepID=A0A1H2NDY1_9ACTN|nr:SDR family oxidoreductase [Microlunatus sagamiharensis]SDV03295.1 NAD(P)-dependent dehydrogenase, short-chain alcohol dehydrogenase family [Microlunatus sagamiharensis]